MEVFGVLFELVLQLGRDSYKLQRLQEMDPTLEKLAALSEPHDYILQRKVTYAEFVPTTDGRRSKAEVRMMFLWPEEGEPILVNNLVRMSQGKMMGVDFNKEKTWVGSSIALHERL